MFATINGVRLYFDIEGSGLRAAGPGMTEAPVIIVLHGSFFDHSCFKPVLSCLADDFQLLYLDFRGFGRSDVSVPEYWSVTQLSADVVALMDHLGIEQAYLFSHSYACCVANTIALSHPERVTGNILMNPVSMERPLFYEKVFELAGAEAQAAAKAVFGEGDINAAEAFLGLVSPLLFQTQLSSDMMARGRMNFEFTLHTLADVWSTDWLEQFKSLSVPILVCEGQKDIYNREGLFQQYVCTANNPRVTLQTFPQSGHFILNDEPDAMLSSLSGFASSF